MLWRDLRVVFSSLLVDDRGGRGEKRGENKRSGGIMGGRDGQQWRWQSSEVFLKEECTIKIYVDG